MSKPANRLQHASSPYLKQHQYNPVDWYPWGEEALSRAERENKPIILSIGYSACHWCHVMEHESFEKDEVADLMNRHFVCIKLDREERPDLDQIYMDSVQAMGVQGGWPLNVFLTPEKKPFYGGTYFPKASWMQLLAKVAEAWQKHQPELEQSAEEFTQSLSTSLVAQFGLKPSSEFNFSQELIEIAFKKFSQKWDTERGGLDYAPKFPMPSHWRFLLQYWKLTGNQEALTQATLTLREMAMGGIYDQVGGGFARYSVDAQWFAPHFEKMLYDNGQLLSLYAQAYKATGETGFKKVVDDTIAWAERELKSPEGGYYAALDADSEGEEGKFYTWTQPELDEAWGEMSDMLSDYYNTEEDGNWESGVNILYRRESAAEFAEKYSLNAQNFAEMVEDTNRTLLHRRAERTRPDLDTKLISGWNGHMLTGLCQAYTATGNEKYKSLCNQLGKFLKSLYTPEGLLHQKQSASEPPIPAFLDDYAAVIDGFLELYQVNFEEEWIVLAKKLVEEAQKNFWDSNEKLFHFTSSTSENLIARKKELFDNVIPASNSLMARNLYRAGLLLSRADWLTQAKEMMSLVQPLLQKEPQYLTNWACLYTEMLANTAEVAIVGKEYKAYAQEFGAGYQPFAVLAGTENTSAEIELLQNREPKGDETLVYVCYEGVCQRPLENVEEALGVMNKL
jgi:uncharacterized protein YyaL (SSP411 family)